MAPRPKRDSTARAATAAKRSCDAQDDLMKKILELSDELDQITMPGVPVEISEEDSIVTQIDGMLAVARAG
jgi:hypothetical protein